LVPQAFSLSKVNHAGAREPVVFVIRNERDDESGFDHKGIEQAN
jgi:hypothetical protein